MSLRTSRLYQCLRPLVLATPIWLACQGLAYAGSWKVNLQDADIHAFINEVANITDKNFVPDPRINGKVTVISNSPMDEEEIYQLFLSVMQVNGVVAIEKDGLIELKPDNLGKQSGLPVDLYAETTGENMVTRVFYLHNMPASELLSAIRSLMPQSAHAAAVPSVNAIVLSDRANSLNELSRLVQELDTGANDKLAVIPLRHTDAERMMEIISELAGTGGTQTQAGNRLKIIADSTSDRLLVTGSPDKIAKIKAMIARIDTIPNKRLSGMKVFQLNYSDASHVANILRALLTGSSINSAAAESNLSKASLSNAKNNNKTNATTNRAKTSSNTSSTASSTLDKSGHHFSIIADETRNAIYVNASGPTMVEIEDFIKKIDTAEVQVLIQAAIIEISGDDVQQLGVQWALGSNNKGYGLINFNNVGVSATSLATSVLSKSPKAISSAAGAIAGTLLGIGQTKNNNGENQFYGAILQAIDKTTSANLLSTPSITTLNHKEASILVGQNVPFVTGSYTSNANGGNNPFQTIERQDVGIQLNVIPHVGADGMVKLDVSQEVSSVVKSNTSNINGLVTNKSSINTTVIAQDGQTVALGGLMRENNSKTRQKVPGIGDVPLLGRLFRSDDKSSQKSNLIIFLQPTVIRTGGVMAGITEKRGDKIKTMQLTIDADGTIKQIPLSGNGGWYAQEVKLTANQRLMPINPLTSTTSAPLAQRVSNLNQPAFNGQDSSKRIAKQKQVATQKTTSSVPLVKTDKAVSKATTGATGQTTDQSNEINRLEERIKRLESRLEKQTSSPADKK